jgi:hypothetical protein
MSKLIALIIVLALAFAAFSIISGINDTAVVHGTQSFSQCIQNSNCLMVK